MNDSHRYCLQVFLSKKVLPQHQLETLIPEICAFYNQVVVNSPDEFFGPINESLHFMNMEIRKIASEHDGKVYYGLINNKNDELTQLATSYSLEQINFFKRFIDLIMTEAKDGEVEEGMIKRSEQQHHNQNTTTTTTTTSLQLEDTVRRLVDDFWLYRSERGMLSLGVRTFLELREYFEMNYQDCCFDCTLCSELVIKGQKCRNEKCNTRLHYHCASRWFARRTGPKTCPTCTNAWNPL
eukprot:TRINITY_DN1255_c0_g1_i2.p1 TRINITY_DN1255_c0_g1~~TRINITY_DN1255_c0_g1_i2.p1  ORF type:complete len:239 (+),score=51.80 TRINITY_DN1255_c0_g1_i2:50-766(+)